jgi:hypothetical protein
MDGQPADNIVGRAIRCMGENRRTDVIRRRKLPQRGANPVSGQMPRDVEAGKPLDDLAFVSDTDDFDATGPREQWQRFRQGPRCLLAPRRPSTPLPLRALPDPCKWTELLRPVCPKRTKTGLPEANRALEIISCSSSLVSGVPCETTERSKRLASRPNSSRAIS